MEAQVIKEALDVILEKFKEDKLTMDEAKLLIKTMYNSSICSPILPPFYPTYGNDYDLDKLNINKVIC